MNLMSMWGGNTESAGRGQTYHKTHGRPAGRNMSTVAVACHLISIQDPSITRFYMIPQISYIKNDPLARCLDKQTFEDPIS